MKYNAHTIVATSVALLFASTSLAYAAVSVSATADTDIETTAMPTRVNAAGRAEGSTGAAPKATLTPVQMNALMQAKEETERKEDGTKDGKAHATGTARAKEMADEHGLEGIENAELHIDLDDEDEGHMETMGTIDDADDVHNADDLHDFIHSVAKKDVRLKSVDVEDGKVKVEYEESAKLFGFLKMKIRAQVSSDTAGNVEVSYPWYHLFTKKAVSQASLQSAIARAIAGERKGEKEGIASTTMHATIATALGIPNIFEIIANTLKDVSAESETEASVAQ